MKQKLTMRMQYIQTGRRITLLYLLTIFTMTGCWIFEVDEVGSYRYISYIKNATEDTLHVKIYNEDTIQYIDTIVSPQEQIVYKGSRVQNQKEVYDCLFEDTDSYHVQIFYSGEVMKTWNGPAEWMGDSIHHFYNYDSWSIEFIEKEYILEFSILPTDFE